MVECVTCKKSMGFADKMNAKSYAGNCVACTSTSRANQGLDEVAIATSKQQVAEAEKENAQLLKKIEAILLTTETAPNLNITKRIDVISAQAAFEINNFKDMFVGFMNPVKGRSNELEKQLDELRVKSTQNLKAKAHEIGANAIVAVDLDLSTVTIGGISMMMMMASGTAVVIETKEGAL